MDDLDSDLNEILEAHAERVTSDDGDISYRAAKDSLKGRYSSNRYLRNEDDLFDDYE